VALAPDPKPARLEAKSGLAAEAGVMTEFSIIAAGSVGPVVLSEFNKRKFMLDV
jgi:hypothetical protein